MRKIKFRGKRIDTGDWVFGNYCVRVDSLIREHCIQVVLKNEQSEISGVSTYQVDPKTVGQYTGLTDKNGKEIYEGDILEHNLYQLGKEVFFKEGSFMYASYGMNKLDATVMWLGNTDYLEISGNIHDL